MKKLINTIVFMCIINVFLYAWNDGTGGWEKGNNLNMGKNSITGDSSTGIYFDPDIDGTNEIIMYPDGSMSVSSMTITGDISLNELIVSTITASSSVGIYINDDAGNLGIFVEDGGYVGIGTNAPLSRFHIKNDGFFITEGTYSSGISSPISGASTSMFFYPQKAAFRAGRVTGTEWDDAEIANYSCAIGLNNTASGERAVALGSGNNAASNTSICLGLDNATGAARAMAIGYENTANGNQSAAIGRLNFTNQNYAMAMGYDNDVRGISSIALGQHNFINTGNDPGFIMASSSTVTGNFAAAFNHFTTAQSYNSFVIGRYNELSGQTTYWLSTDTLFVAGNGSADGSRSNAMTLLKDGNLGIGITNPSEKVEVDGMIISSGCYASVYVADGSTTTVQAIGTGATYVKITAFANDGLALNCTADSSNDKITITKKGVYLLNGSFSFASGTNNVIFFGAAFLNAVEQDQIHFNRKIGTAGDVGSVSFSGTINVTTVPWDLDFRVRHDNGGSVNIAFSYANLAINYIGADQ